MPSSEQDIQMILKQAIALHQAGNLVAAEKIYGEILGRDQARSDVLTLFGTLLLQKGDIAGGIAKLDASLAIEPEQPAALYNRGTALIGLRQPQAALENLAQALALKPDYVEAHCKSGIAFTALGNHRDALDAFDRALALKPDYADAHLYRGNVLRGYGQYEEALASYDRAIAAAPRHIEANNNRANMLMELKRYEEAVTSYDATLALMPNFAPAHYNRGNALRALRRPEQALECYDAALSLKTDYPEALNNRALVLEDLHRYEDALASFDRALALRPDYPEALHNRGNALRWLERAEEALDSYDRALALKPGDLAMLSDRCLALQERGDIDEALAGYEHILTLKPDYAETLNNRGVLLASLKRYEEAIANYDAAVAARSDYAEAHSNKALLQILRGQYEEGWQLYEWRWKMSDRRHAARSYLQPLWLGETDIAGKTMLLWAEQALGDTLQFIRFAKLAETAGARIILEVQPPLVSLTTSSFPKAAVIAAGENPPPFDLHCPLASLPLAFGTTIDSIPGSPYLTRDPARQSEWQKKLGPKIRPRIGIAWSGSGAYRNDVRSMPASALTPLFDLDIEIHSLQKDVRSEDQAALSSFPIHRHESEFGDFADTAGLIAELDLVLSVDTSVAHLAGGMGRPLWALLAFSTDWRWAAGDEDSRWYPTAHIFRQPVRRDWTSVVAKVTAALKDRFKR